MGCLDSCRNCLHSIGTCSCKWYVYLMSIVHCIFAVLLLILLIVFQGWEAYTRFALGEELGGELFGEFWEAKASMLVGVISLFFLACCGMKYKNDRSRKTGLIVLVLLILPLGFQVYAFSHVFASEHNLELLDSWLDGRIVPDDWTEYTDPSRAKAVKNMYNHFTDAMSTWDCTTDNTVPDFLAQEGHTSTVVRRLHAEEGRQVHTLDLGKCGGTKSTTCTKNSGFATILTDHCDPKVGDDDRIQECGSCLDPAFLTSFGIDEGLTPEQNATLIANHAGDKGMMFCRCLPATTRWLEGQAQAVLIVTLVYVGVELLFLISTMWLIMCGPDAAQKDAQRQIELGMDDPGDGSMQVQVVCPFDSGPGESVLVRFEGREKQVIVPEGIRPGQVFYTWV